MQLPDDWMANEKGNTWLSDDDGNHVAWLKVGDRMLEISVTPGNSPGFWARVVGEENIADHINKNLQGWTVHRCNIDGVSVEDDMISLDK